MQAAAERFEAAGAQVQTIAPFFTRHARQHGRLLAMRSWLDFSALPPARQAMVLPFIVAWLKGGAKSAASKSFAATSQMGAMREAAVAAHRPFDVVLSPTSPVPAFRAELAAPTDDPMRSLRHIAYTVPYNARRAAGRDINCSWTKAGLPIGLQIAGKRHDDLGVLQVARAWEAMRPAPRCVA